MAAENAAQSSSSKPLPLSSTQFDSYSTSLQSSALQTTRHALSLPRDLSFHRSLESELSSELDAFSGRVMSLTNRLLALAGTTTTSGKGKRKLETQDDIVDDFEGIVVDVMDGLFESVDMCLDEFLGRRKPPAIVVNPPQSVPKKVRTIPRGRLDPALLHASSIRKPQLDFKRKVVNDDSPWYPTLKHKWNAIVPLGYVYRDDGDDEGTISLHPYQYELTHPNYPSFLFTRPTPKSPESFTSTPFTYISTLSAFQSMVSKLKYSNEIAVDLEHHDYRSYRGFVCLMQLSTREEDWVIDCLVPEVREAIGGEEGLGDVFSDRRIVKVLHGADSDIVWLQRDFNLYVVNMFDTYHASKVLEFPRHGLANLLEMYCDFTPDKRYQLADWRIRPLPEEMLEYARSDTHFLLYIYDNLRNALLDLSLSRPPSPPPLSSSSDANTAHAHIQRVLSLSASTALRVYSQEAYDEEGGGSLGWDSMARKWNKRSLTRDAGGGVWRDVLRAVHRWREQVGREEDESVRYVLPNHYLFLLAEKPPNNMVDLVGMFQSVPAVIRRRSGELLEVVKAAVKRFAEEGKKDVEEMDVSGGQEEVVIGETREDVGEDVDVTQDSGTADRLWSNVSKRRMETVPSSSLFGTSLSTSKVPPSAYTTSNSTLFGSKSVLNGTQTYHARFKDVVTRIHQSLVITPTVLEVTTKSVDTQTEPTEVTADAPGSSSSGMIEIPYVPASQRRVEVIEDDSIVVVGQSRKRKRKRKRGGDSEPVSKEGSVTVDMDGPKAKVKVKAVQENLEPFDYSSAPNILDDAPEPEPELEPETKKRKQKLKGVVGKGGKVEYGSFPAPPKAHRELKSGNQSMTFR